MVLLVWTLQRPVHGAASLWANANLCVERFSMPSTRNPPQEVMFDLSQRLDEAQLSLAWAYLYQEDPTLPVPKELKHLTAPEWELANNLLLQNLHLRELLPLQ